MGLIVNPPEPAILFYFSVPAILKNGALQPTISTAGMAGNAAYSADGKTAYLKIYAATPAALTSLQASGVQITKAQSDTAYATFKTSMESGSVQIMTKTNAPVPVTVAKAQVLNDGA